MTIEQRVNAANAQAVEILTKAHPRWTDVQKALDVIPGMTSHTVLVSGPPLPVEQLTYPIQTSVCGAIIHEKLAQTRDEAWNMVLNGQILCPGPPMRMCRLHDSFRLHAGNHCPG